MTLLVEDEMVALEEHHNGENELKRTKKASKRFRRSVILSMVSAVVSMVTFVGCVIVTIFVFRVLSQHKQTVRVSFIL